jgi:hypothetical protein
LTSKYATISAGPPSRAWHDSLWASPQLVTHAASASVIASRPDVIVAALAERRRIMRELPAVSGGGVSRTENWGAVERVAE